MKEIQILENMINNKEKYDKNELINQLSEVSDIIVGKQSEIDDLQRENENLNEYISKIEHELNMYKRMIQGLIQY